MATPEVVIWPEAEGIGAIIMFDGNDDAKGEYRTVEVQPGSLRRRRWSAEEKARIVEETLVPGARLSEVARRWQVCSQQIYGWRRAACQDVKVEPAKTTGSAALGFVPIVREVVPPATAPRVANAAPVIEIKLAGAVVRVVSGMDDAAQLTVVLRAVRASGSRG
jgi:transposase